MPLTTSWQSPMIIIPEVRQARGMIGRVRASRLCDKKSEADRQCEACRLVSAGDEGGMTEHSYQNDIVAFRKCPRRSDRSVHCLTF